MLCRFPVLVSESCSTIGPLLEPYVPRVLFLINQIFQVQNWVRDVILTNQEKPGDRRDMVSACVVDSGAMKIMGP